MPRVSETNRRSSPLQFFIELHANFLFFCRLWLHLNHGQGSSLFERAWHPTCLSLAGVLLFLRRGRVDEIQQVEEVCCGRRSACVAFRRFVCPVRLDRRIEAQ